MTLVCRKRETSHTLALFSNAMSQLKNVGFKATPEEIEFLNTYCEQNSLTKVEVLRSLLRSLADKIKK